MSNDFFGYHELSTIAADLKNEGVHYLDHNHKLRVGDVVVHPDNEEAETGKTVGLICWISQDKSEVIVRGTHYQDYTDIERKDWKYTGLNVSRLHWLSFWGDLHRKS